MPCDIKTDVSLLELIIRRRVARSQERQHATDRAARVPAREPRTVRIDIDTSSRGVGGRGEHSAAALTDRGGRIALAPARDRLPLHNLFSRVAGVSE